MSDIKDSPNGPAPITCSGSLDVHGIGVGWTWEHYAAARSGLKLWSRRQSPEVAKLAERLMHSLRSLQDAPDSPTARRMVAVDMAAIEAAKRGHQ